MIGGLYDKKEAILSDYFNCFITGVILAEKRKQLHYE